MSNKTKKIKNSAGLIAIIALLIITTSYNLNQASIPGFATLDATATNETVNKNITEDLIHEVVSFARPKEVKEVLELTAKGDFIKARDKLLGIMLNYGLNGLEIIKQIQKEILSLNISEKDKLRMIEKCGDVEFRLVEGSDEFVQLEALLASFCLNNNGG